MGLACTGAMAMAAASAAVEILDRDIVPSLCQLGSSPDLSIGTGPAAPNTNRNLSRALQDFVVKLTNRPAATVGHAQPVERTAQQCENRMGQGHGPSCTAWLDRPWAAVKCAPVI
jgi:hypothetical protein